MEKILNILSSFFENPKKEFYIRELAKILKTNHTTVRNYLKKLEKENFLIMNKTGLYPSYRLNLSKKALNLKLFYNIEKLRKSNLIEDLEKYYDFPAIVLFGSYSKAMDDKESDIDICVISKIKKEFNVKDYEKKLNREISLHHFEDVKAAKNKGLINSICNGIVLSGDLEVF